MRVFFILLSVCLFYQVTGQSIKGHDHRYPLLGRIVLNDLPEIGAGIQSIEQYNPPKRRLDRIKPPYQPVPAPLSQNLGKAGAPDPSVVFGFTAQTPSGTPLDNNLAIGRNGLIISAVNTTIRVTDSSGSILFTRTLSVIANALGTLDRTFDPHVIYDMESDRFILLFLNGSDHTKTNLIVGFSEGNDPRGAWNFYAIPGNVTQNDWWSDYPFAGISQTELFISVLLWMDDETGWDTDAVDENIWQISKGDGYSGSDTLRMKLYRDLEYGGRQLWNTRPMGQSDRLYGPDFYFLGNRPKDAANDTVFLIHISGTLDDTSTTLSIVPLKSDVPYGLQPNVTQLGGRRLRTNYCDIQNGYRFEDRLYFCANTIHTPSGRPAVYIGRVMDLNGNPYVTAQIYAVDSLDLNYPSIAYSGGGWPDESAMVLCLHNSQNSWPGSSAFALGRDFTPSNLVRLKAGEGAMNILHSDSLERWGDYTGIQRDYARTGRVWMAGSFGRSNSLSQTWIAAVSNQDPQLSVGRAGAQEALVYPNPGRQFVVEFELATAGICTIRLTDLSGKELLSGTETLSAGWQRLSIDTLQNRGTYLLTIIDAKGRLVLSETVVVE